MYLIAAWELKGTRNYDKALQGLNLFAISKLEDAALHFVQG